MAFCSMNSASSVFTLKIPKKKKCTLNTRMMHLNNQEKPENVGHFMHSTVTALIT